MPIDIAMSLEAARDLSIQDLLRMLNEKFGLEYARIREISSSCTVPAASLELEVSTRQPILFPMGTAIGSNFSGLDRLTVSRPEHTMF